MSRRRNRGATARRRALGVALLLAASVASSPAAAGGAVAAADPALFDAYRALGYRALLDASLEERLMQMPPGATRDSVAAQLASERIRDRRPLDALRLLAARRGEGADLAWVVALRDAGYPEAALDHLDRMRGGRAGADADSAAELEDVLSLLEGTLAHRLGRLERAIDELSVASRLGETREAHRHAERSLILALIETGALDRAAQRMTQRGSLDWLGDAGIPMMLVERLLAAARHDAALALLEKITSDFRGCAESVKAYELSGELRQARGDSLGVDYYLRGARLANEAGWNATALRMAREAKSRASDRTRREDAARLEALSLYGLNRYPEASRALAELRESSEGESVRRDALLFLARSERRRGRGDESRRCYRQFLDEYPNDPFAGEVSWHLAWEARRRDRLEAALAEFRALAHSVPRDKRADEAFFNEALCHLALGDTAEAQADLERLVARGPTEPLGAQALYFGMALAKVAAQPARADSLRARLLGGFRDTFYRTYVVSENAGTEAQWWRPPPGAEAFANDVSRAYSPEREEEAARRWSATLPSEPAMLPEHRRLRRAEALIAAGLAELAEAEIYLYENDGERSAWRDFLLSRLYRRHAFFYRALAAGSRFANSAPGERPDEVQRFLFPAAFLDLVVRAASEAGFDPRLLLAIAREESWFDPGVVSSAKAVGLAQLLPSTARRVAARVGEPGIPPPGLTDPWVNLRLGALYLAGLLREFDGSTMLAASAYNAGEGSARKWRPHHDPSDPPSYIEAVSYTETRNYIKKVLRTYWAYRSAYPAGREAAEPRPR